MGESKRQASGTRNTRSSGRQKVPEADRRGTRSTQILKITVVFLSSGGLLTASLIFRYGFLEMAGLEDVSKEAGGHQDGSPGLLQRLPAGPPRPSLPSRRLMPPESRTLAEQHVLTIAQRKPALACKAPAPPRGPHQRLPPRSVLATPAQGSAGPLRCSSLCGCNLPTHPPGWSAPRFYPTLARCLRFPWPNTEQQPPTPIHTSPFLSSLECNPHKGRRSLLAGCIPGAWHIAGSH